ncbi:sterile alpha motif domain-containing protein 1 [Brachyhypopomus gauderio]|uniref:sterile alpha motif domain-containing protein 1 n=1 Tax=Brachyhypopomus gauderio TaxID=698409 RepID=UPI0040420231
MSEPRYREWILETIDSLRSRKARPDLERICRMVRRRHGSDPDRTRAELDKLIQEQTVLKVSYKGSISYRNAAKVQRKCRKKVDQTNDNSSGSGESVGEQTKHANFNNNGDSAHSPTEQEECDDQEPEPPGASPCYDPLPHTSRPTKEKAEKILSVSSGNSFVSCGATSSPVAGGCAVKASAAKDGGLIPQTGGTRSSPCRESGTGEDDASSPSKRVGGEETLSLCHEGDEEKEQKTCPSASSAINSQAQRNKPPVPLKPKLKVGAKGSGNGSDIPDQTSADLGDRLVAAVRSLSERNRGSVALRGHALLGLKEILGYLSTQAGQTEEKLTRNRVKVVLEREIERGRLRRSRLGHITVPARGMGAAKPSARLLKSALQDRHLVKKEEVKEVELMQAESECNEKMEVESEVSTLAAPQSANVGVQVEATGPAHDPLSPSPEISPCDVCQPAMMSEERFQPPSPLSPKSSVHQEAESCGSEGPTLIQVPPAGTGCFTEEQRENTPAQLHDHTQAIGMSDSVKVPSSIPIKSYSGCKMEVGVSSCLLTPSASPGVAEERGINGGIFVKSESSAVNPMDWTVADVASYFTAAGFPEQALAFRTQEIDGKSLLLMQRNDVLTGLSIRLGPALKIYERHVKVLQRTHFQDDGTFC